MKKTASKPIGIFDSGLGGLTVLKEIRELLPGEDLIYFGDSGRAPYGTKSTETVRKCTESDIRLLLSKDVKAIVAACNTAAACSGREFLESFGVPVVDVIRAGSEEAARVSKTGRIGVIGTQATIRSGIYETSIKSLRGDCVFTGKACPLFVPLVEEGWWDNEITAAVCK
ncbi:MAG: glutamate racemase, partial [Clostridia bacterium]|nr:glutamate racemase [Clostridia bacterium]